MLYERSLKEFYRDTLLQFTQLTIILILRMYWGITGGTGFVRLHL